MCVIHSLWEPVPVHSTMKLRDPIHLPVYIPGYCGLQEHPLRLPPCPLRCEVEGTGYNYLCIYLATGDSLSTLWGSLLAHSGMNLRDWVYLPVYTPGYWSPQVCELGINIVSPVLFFYLFHLFKQVIKMIHIFISKYLMKIKWIKNKKKKITPLWYRLLMKTNKFIVTFLISLLFLMIIWV